MAQHIGEIQLAWRSLIPLSIFTPPPSSSKLRHLTKASSPVGIMHPYIWKATASPLVLWSRADPPVAAATGAFVMGMPPAAVLVLTNSSAVEFTAMTTVRVCDTWSKMFGDTTTAPPTGPGTGTSLNESCGSMSRDQMHGWCCLEMFNESAASAHEFLYAGR